MRGAGVPPARAACLRLGDLGRDRSSGSYRAGILGPPLPQVGTAACRALSGDGDMGSVGTRPPGTPPPPSSGEVRYLTARNNQHLSPSP